MVSLRDKIKIIGEADTIILHFALKSVGTTCGRPPSLLSTNGFYDILKKITGRYPDA